MEHYSPDECYAQYFADPSIVPTDVSQSLQSKMDAQIAAMDSAIGTMDSLYGPNTGFAQSFGMMGN